MGGHKVLQYVKSLTEIGFNRKLDGPSGGIRHQSPHTGQLFNLLVGTTGARVRHHINVIIFIQSCKQNVCQLFIRFIPGFHNRTVSFLLGDKAAAVVLGNPVYRCLRLVEHFRLLGRHRHIGNGNGHCRPCGILIPCGFNQIQYLGCHRSAVNVDYLFKNLL